MLKYRRENGDCGGNASLGNRSSSMSRNLNNKKPDDQAARVTLCLSARGGEEENSYDFRIHLYVIIGD